jgi:hypothetical protein
MGSVCDVYCANAAANCTGDNAIYPNDGACQAACAGMPVGDPTDQAGNTAWCRAYHAGTPAETGAAAHCPHASISSNEGICGAPCDAYCDQAMANCTGSGESSDWADRAACTTACETWTLGSWDDDAADSVQCRAYHASWPAADSPTTHCGHAGADGDDQCIDVQVGR